MTEGDEWVAWVREATAAVTADLARQREELATEFMAGCTPHEWGRVITLHEFGDFDLGRPAPNGYTRVSSTEYVGFVVRPVGLLGQRELGRWFTMTLIFRNHLATKGAI